MSTHKHIFIYTRNILSFISQLPLTYMTFFYITRFIGMIEFYHTIPFLMDILGLVLTMSLALTQVCWQQRKHF